MSTVIFSELPTFWKTFIVIGFISTLIFIVLLIIIIYLLFDTKIKNEEQDISEFEDFLNEFKDGKTCEENEESSYPILPKIKDLKGDILKNLLQIDII
jgi:uncharacterized protein YacL